MKKLPIQTAYCFYCGVEIRRSTVPPAIWVHNDYHGLREHDALPDVDEAVRDALLAAEIRVAKVFADAHRLMSDGHYSYIVPSSDEVIEAVRGGND
jgi:hypothetical protein